MESIIIKPTAIEIGKNTYNIEMIINNVRFNRLNPVDINIYEYLSDAPKTNPLFKDKTLHAEITENNVVFNVYSNSLWETVCNEYKSKYPDKIIANYSDYYNFAQRFREENKESTFIKPLSDFTMPGWKYDIEIRLAEQQEDHRAYFNNPKPYDPHLSDIILPSPEKIAEIARQINTNHNSTIIAESRYTEGVTRHFESFYGWRLRITDYYDVQLQL